MDNDKINRLLSFRQWSHELRNPQILRANMLAGLAVALVLIPQALAYAQLAGLPPVYGLYAAFIPTLIAALCGSSRQLITGPVIIVSIMTATTLQPYAFAGTPEYIGLALALALLVGIYQLTLGFTRLEFLTNFLSKPVVLGFSNAAAVIIIASQLDEFFGVAILQTEPHYISVWTSLGAIFGHVHWQTVFMGILALTTLIVLKRVSPTAPGLLIAVILTSLLSWTTGFHQERTLPLTVIHSTDAQIAIDTYLKNNQQLVKLSRDIQNTTLNEQKNYLLAQKNALNIETNKAWQHIKSLRFYPVKTSLLLANDIPENALLGSGEWRIKHITREKQMIVYSGGQVVGSISQSLPSMTLPDMEWSALFELLVAALAISLLSFRETTEITKKISARNRQKIDNNQEIIGQGLANIIGSFFQSFPTSGSSSRSNANIEAGATNGAAAITSSLIVGLFLLWFTPLLYHLPQATLAAIIMVAAIRLVDIESILRHWKIHKHDSITAIVTFSATLIFLPQLDKGLLLGLVFSLGFYLYRSMQPRIVEIGRHPDGSLRDIQVYNLPTCDKIHVLRFDGSLYFVNVTLFATAVIEKLAQHPDMKILIIDGQGVNQIDSSGEESLHELSEQLREEGVQIYFSAFKKQIIDTLQKSHFIQVIGPEHFFYTTEDALKYAWTKIECRNAQCCVLNEKTRENTDSPDIEATSTRSIT